MIDYLVLFFASLAISSVVAYGCWAKVRVWLLRDRLFAIRNDLWMCAHEKFAFDDPAYNNARDHLNALIQFANLWSFPVVQHISGKVGETSVERATTGDEELQRVIDKAYDESAEVLLNYVFFHRASGWFVLVRLIGTTIVECSFGAMKATYRRMKDWLKSPAAENFSTFESLSAT